MGEYKKRKFEIHPGICSIKFIEFHAIAKSVTGTLMKNVQIPISFSINLVFCYCHTNLNNEPLTKRLLLFNCLKYSLPHEYQNFSA
jgi:hypothetical protein